jgi:zinc protease
MRELLNFRRYTLDNGLRVLILEDHTLPILSYQVHVKAGSRFERPGITGISHLFEHMMFRGTSRLGPEEFSKIIQSRGGIVNAFTTQDHTTYWENVPSDQLELVIELEAHRLKELKLDQESFSTEREVVRSERKMRISTTPYGAAYLRHPYRWPIIGWDSDLRKLSLKDCQEYFRLHYAPNSMVIVVCGDVVPERVLDLIYRYYGNLRPQECFHEIEPEPPQRGERKSVFKKPVELEAIFWAYHVPGIDSEDIFPLLGICECLSGGKSSRFWQKFVRPGKATEVRLVADPPPFWPKDPGLLILYAIEKPGTPLPSLEGEIEEEMRLFKKEGPTKDELEKVKNRLKASFLRNLESLFFRGLVGGIYEIKLDGFEKSWEILEKYESLKAEDMIRVAEKYLHEDNRTSIWVKSISLEENARFGLIE